MAPSAIAGAHGIDGTSARTTTATATVVSPTANIDQPRDRRPVVLEISERRVVRRVEQYGCDEERQRKLGRERERRRDRKEREQRAAERQEHRIRCSDAAGSRRQDHRGDEQSQELFEFPHVTALNDT